MPKISAIINTEISSRPWWGSMTKDRLWSILTAKLKKGFSKGKYFDHSENKLIRFRFRPLPQNSEFSFMRNMEVLTKWLRNHLSSKANHIEFSIWEHSSPTQLSRALLNWYKLLAVKRMESKKFKVFWMFLNKYMSAIVKATMLWPMKGSSFWIKWWKMGPWAILEHLSTLYFESYLDFKWLFLGKILLFCHIKSSLLLAHSERRHNIDKNCWSFNFEYYWESYLGYRRWWLWTWMSTFASRTTANCRISKYEFDSPELIGKCDTNSIR